MRLEHTVTITATGNVKSGVVRPVEIGVAVGSIVRGSRGPSGIELQELLLELLPATAPAAVEALNRVEPAM
jgi:hypothetical protein